MESNETHQDEASPFGGALDDEDDDKDYVDDEPKHETTGTEISP